jgi:hypothetical protein
MNTIEESCRVGRRGAGAQAQSPAGIDGTNRADRKGCARAGPDVAFSGRSTGGDRVSHAAVRNMMCCAVSGQEAGVAAAMQTELRRQAARIQ